MLVGPRQVARSDTAGHVGSKLLRAHQAVSGGRDLALSAPERPPGITDRPRQSQLSGADVEIDRLKLRVGQACGAVSLAWKPKRKRDHCLVLSTARAKPSRFCLQL